LKEKKAENLRAIATVARSAKRLSDAYEILADPHTQESKRLAYNNFIRTEIRILFPRLLRLWLRVQFTKYPW
jgi:hypothetical protein